MYLRVNQKAYVPIILNATFKLKDFSRSNAVISHLCCKKLYIANGAEQTRCYYRPLNRKWYKAHQLQGHSSIASFQMRFFIVVQQLDKNLTDKNSIMPMQFLSFLLILPHIVVQSTVYAIHFRFVSFYCTCALYWSALQLWQQI